MLERTTVRRFIVDKGLPVGLAMLLIFGVIGLITDSTLLGVFAGMGLMMAIGSNLLKRGEGLR